MAIMWKKYKKWWMQNFSKSVDNRSGWEAFLHLINLFFVNCVIIVVWFSLLIILTKLAVNLGLISNNDAAPVSIMVFYILACTHLMIFSYSKFGGRLVSMLAKHIEQAIRDALLGNARIVGLPDAALIPDYSESFLSHIPPVPCAPPRAYLA